MDAATQRALALKLQQAFQAYGISVERGRSVAGNLSYRTATFEDYLALVALLTAKGYRLTNGPSVGSPMLKLVNWSEPPEET